MPRACSTGLRERVLRACERGRLSRARIAAVFGVGETTLFRWRRQARVEGRQMAKPPRAGPAPRLDGAALAALRALVAEANASTLAEYADRLAERSGVRASAPTLCRALRKLGLVRKKPSGPRGRTGPTSSRPGRLGAPSWPRSTQGA
ncbi:MAG TPA: helix-turn-helix domain-containing protein [Geminicoccaceae bacterium]|nr:helix-turn-helix domain-containing protein [Geminicoccaceae bacterium]